MLATLVNSIYFSGLTVAVGAVALRYLVMTRSGLVISERAPALRDAAKYGLGGSAAVLLAAPLRGLVQAQGLAAPGDPLLPLLRTVLTTSDLGRALLLQAIWSAAAMAAFSVARLGPQRGWSAAAITVVILALGPALTGHAVAADPLLPAQVAAVAHTLAAGAWIGTLFHLWRIARKSSDATLKRLLSAFHAVALGSASVLALSGAYQVWSIIETPSQLWATWWGRLLLLKLAALGAVMWLGYRRWKDGEGLLATGDRTTLRERMTRGLWAAAAVLVVTGLLSTTGLE